MARMTPSDDRHAGRDALQCRNAATVVKGPAMVRQPFTATRSPIRPDPALDPRSDDERLDIRRAYPGDLDAVATLFGTTYPESVRVRIGKAATYFDRYCSGPDVCLLATLRGRLVGVTYGSSFARDLPASLGRSHTLGLVLAVLAGAIQRPRVLLLVADRILRSRNRRRGWRSLVVPALADAAHGEPIIASDICVVHVFVGQGFQGRGVGSALLNAYFSVMGEAGYGWCVAHTMAESGPVHRLNERVGLNQLIATGNDLVWARRLGPNPLATA